MCGGDRKRDRNRKPRAYVQGEADERDQEIEAKRQVLGNTRRGMSLQLGKTKMTTRTRILQMRTKTRTRILQMRTKKVLSRWQARSCTKHGQLRETRQEQLHKRGQSCTISRAAVGVTVFRHRQEGIRHWQGQRQGQRQELWQESRRRQ